MISNDFNLESVHTKGMCSVVSRCVYNDLNVFELTGSFLHGCFESTYQERGNCAEAEVMREVADQVLPGPKPNSETSFFPSVTNILAVKLP